MTLKIKFGTKYTTTINSEIFAIVNSTSVYEQLGNFRTSVEIYSEEAKSWN